jgi:Protein of unknown function (DUF1761)
MTSSEIKLTYLRILAAVLAAVVISGVWYSPLVLGREWMALRSAEGGVSDPRLVPWRPVVELIREFVVGYVMLRFVRQTRVETLGQAARLGFWVWLGFPVMMLAGASLWDSKSWELSLIQVRRLVSQDACHGDRDYGRAAARDTATARSSPAVRWSALDTSGS